MYYKSNIYSKFITINPYIQSLMSMTNVDNNLYVSPLILIINATED